MKRRFFRYFKVRIPRKLKKAAKYGVKKHIYPTTEKTETAFGHVFIYNEKIEFVIVGKRTKWKAKMCQELMKEYKENFVTMFLQRQSDRIITPEFKIILYSPPYSLKHLANEDSPSQEENEASKNK